MKFLAIVLASASVASTLAAPAFAGTSVSNTYTNESGSVHRVSESKSSSNFVKVQDNVSTSLKQECSIPSNAAGYNRCSYGGSISAAGFTGNQEGYAQTDPTSIQSGSFQKETAVIVGQQEAKTNETYNGIVTVFDHTQSTDSF